MKNVDWTRDEHILAFNLYCKIPFTKINDSYPPIKELALVLGRTNGSVAMKMANFARLDPALQARNVSGLKRGAKGEEDVWNEFTNNWENLAFESERILAYRTGTPIEVLAELPDDEILLEGKEREALVKIRINQNFFRKSVLASYNDSCCITGLAMPELLVAGHILPWASDERNRTNPSNGLCMNALHDKAFDRGLMTITPDYEIRVADQLLDKERKCGNGNFFLAYHGKQIILPRKFLPQQEFLEHHSTVLFRG
jgi:putative restriction endonuclease